MPVSGVRVAAWATPEEIRAIAAEHGIRLAQTPRSAKVRCLGCLDSENLEDPTGGAPRRCGTCPVTRKARQLAAGRA